MAARCARVRGGDGLSFWRPVVRRHVGDAARSSECSGRHRSASAPSQLGVVVPPLPMVSVFIRGRLALSLPTNADCLRSSRCSSARRTGGSVRGGMVAQASARAAVISGGVATRRSSVSGSRSRRCERSSLEELERNDSTVALERHQPGAALLMSLATLPNDVSTDHTAALSTPVTWRRCRRPVFRSTGRSGRRGLTPVPTAPVTGGRPADQLRRLSGGTEAGRRQPRSEIWDRESVHAPIRQARRHLGGASRDPWRSARSRR
jgi:hypothetical protein